MPRYATPRLTKADYHDTSTGTYISRRACLYNTTSIEFPGGNCFIGSGVVVRGDFGTVRIDRYCDIGDDTIVRPSYLMNSGLRFIPLHIGSCTTIGKNCVIESAVIGVGCDIGDDCILGKRTILRDFVTVMPGSLIPPDMVIPPFAIVAGYPARIVSENPESTSTLVPTDAKDRFKRITASFTDM